MISERMPIRNRTSVRRRCSSSSVVTSLNSGTTIDNRIPFCVLRDMAKAPARRAREIVSDQLHALADEKRPGRYAAQQGDLFQPRLDEARGQPPQRLVDVAGMNHQFGDARRCRPEHRLQRLTCEGACGDASDEV